MEGVGWGWYRKTWGNSSCSKGNTNLLVHTNWEKRYTLETYVHFDFPSHTVGFFFLAKRFRIGTCSMKQRCQIYNEFVWKTELLEQVLCILKLHSYQHRHASDGIILHTFTLTYYLFKTSCFSNYANNCIKRERKRGVAFYIYRARLN